MIHKHMIRYLLIKVMSTAREGKEPCVEGGPGGHYRQPRSEFIRMVAYQPVILRKESVG